MFSPTEMQPPHASAEAALWTCITVHIHKYFLLSFISSDLDLIGTSETFVPISTNNDNVGTDIMHVAVRPRWFKMMWCFRSQISQTFPFQFLPFVCFPPVWLPTPPRLASLAFPPLCIFNVLMLLSPHFPSQRGLQRERCTERDARLEEPKLQIEKSLVL